MRTNTGVVTSNLELTRASVAPEVVYARDCLLEQPLARERVICYLAEVYHYVNNVRVLMRRALDRTADQCSPFAYYMQQLIIDGSDRCELLLDDFEQLNLNRQLVASNDPLRSTINAIGSQLYVIENLDPRFFLGCIYLTGCSAIRVERLEELALQLKVNPACLQYLYKYSVTDANRKTIKLENWMELHIDDATTLDGIERNMRNTGANIAEVFLEIAYLDNDAVANRVSNLKASVH